ncbi:hypothetical protein ScPMuIL_017207 [Solemya velum]
MSKEIRKTEKDLNLTDRDLTNVEDLVTVLKPLRTITTVLCDEQNPTISLIYPLKQQILSLMQVQGTDSTMIKNVQNAICNDIQKRYSDKEEFLLMTSALDPRFRSLPWLDDDKRFSVYTSLIHQTSEASNQVYVKQEPEDPQPGPSVLPDLPQTYEESDKERQTKSKAKQDVSTNGPEPSVPHQSSAMQDLFGDAQQHTFGQQTAHVWTTNSTLSPKTLANNSNNQKLDDESLNTLFCEVEAIVNSRPITVVSNDPNDLQPLTPNHLLLLRSGLQLPLINMTLADTYRKKWKHVQFLANCFWKRWLKEYLPTLQLRQKWTHENRNFAVGNVVLVQDANTHCEAAFVDWRVEFVIYELIISLVKTLCFCVLFFICSYTM